MKLHWGPWVKTNDNSSEKRDSIRSHTSEQKTSHFFSDRYMVVPQFWVWGFGTCMKNYQIGMCSKLWNKMSCLSKHIFWLILDSDTTQKTNFGQSIRLYSVLTAI